MPSPDLTFKTQTDSNTKEVRYKACNCKVPYTVGWVLSLVHSTILQFPRAAQASHAADQRRTHQRLQQSAQHYRNTHASSTQHGRHNSNKFPVGKSEHIFFDVCVFRTSKSEYDENLNGGGGGDASSLSSCTAPSCTCGGIILRGIGQRVRPKSAWQTAFRDYGT